MSATHEVTVRSRRVLAAAAARALAVARGCDPRAVHAVFPGGRVVALTLAVEPLQADIRVFHEATEVARLLVHSLGSAVPLVVRLPALFEQDWTLTPADACLAFAVSDAGELVVWIPAELAPPGRLRRWQAHAWPARVDPCFQIFPPPAGAPSLGHGAALLPHADGQDFALARATLSPDGALLATGGEHGTVALWRTADLGEELRLLEDFQEDGDPSPYVQFSPDGRRLAWSSLDGDGLRLRGLGADGETTRVPADFYPYEFCPGGETLVAQTGDAGLVLIATSTGELLRRLAPGSAGQDRTNFTLAPRTNLLAVATRGVDVQVLTLADGAPRWREPLAPADGPPPELAFDPAGERLAVSRPDGAITVHDARSGALLRTITTSQENGHAVTTVMSLDFSPDGEFLAVAVCERWPRASASQVWIFRVADGVVLRKLGAPSRGVLRVEFAPGPLLLVQDYDRVTLHRTP